MAAKTTKPGSDVLPLPTEGFGSAEWWAEALSAGEKVRDDLKEAEWKPNVEAYRRPKKNDKATPVNVDFYNTERKKAELYFRTPEMQLTAKRPEFADATVVFQAVVNQKIGPDEMHLSAAMDECLFDLLCPAGIFAVKIGYEAIQDGTTPMESGEMQPDPAFVPPVQPGDVLGVNPIAEAPLVPVMVNVPNIIHERYFIDRVSPGALILPKSFHGSNYDKAPWKAWRFVEDVSVGKRKGWVPEDFQGSGEDKYRLTDEPDGGAARDLLVGTEVWYPAYRFDPTCKNPDKYRQLIFIEGLDQPVVHRDSPYQRFDPVTGKMTGGMKGSPLDVSAIRYVSDSAYPPSDCTISRTQVDELSEYRAQMKKQRERAIAMRWADRNRIDPADVDRIKKADLQGLLMLDGNGSEIIGEVARAEYPRENFSFMEIVERDIAKEWALNNNTSGQSEEGNVSATESSLMSRAIDIRQDYERGKLSAHVVRIVSKAASLIQLFADQEDYIEVQGDNGAKRLEPWDKTRIQGQFVYSMKPDSAQRIDAAADRKQFNDFVNFHAKNPYMNQAEMSRIAATKNNLDPSTLLKQPDPPPQEKPSVTWSIKVEDFYGPGAMVAVELAAQAGVVISAKAVATAQTLGALLAAEEAAQKEAEGSGGPQGKPETPQHGGPADKAELLSKRSADQTGQLSGAGTVASQASVQ